jgi:hypothetical protein
MAVLVDVAFHGHAETTIHLVCALGFVLLTRASSDLSSRRWHGSAGSAVAAALAIIFTLQALSNLVPNAALHRIAFPILGATPERILADALLAWMVVLLLTDGRGRCRIWGFIALAPAVVIEALDAAFLVADAPTYSAPPALKLALLLPFAWLLCESRKPAAT